MKNHLGPVSFPLVLASLFVLLTLTVALSHPASAQLAAPNHLRVDISDGTTGQLFVSWDQVSGATYYELQRSTSPSSGYADVPNCSALADANNLGTPWVSKICRDNNGGNPTLTPGTTYYYQVRACNSTPCTGTYTSTTPVPSNIPVTCNTSTSQIPPMCSGSPRTCLHAPPKLPACSGSLMPPNCVYPTSTITP